MDVFANIRQSASSADTAINAVKHSLAKELLQHAEVLQLEVGGDVVKDERILTSPVPMWAVGAAGVVGLAIGAVSRLFG